MNKVVVIIYSLLLLQSPTFAAETVPHLLSQESSRNSELENIENTESSYCEVEREQEELSNEQIKTLANKITVKVTGDNNVGSGTILGKEGNSYLVITNSHMVRGVSKINLTTFDGKIHRGEIVTENNFDKQDLVLLSFDVGQNQTDRNQANRNKTNQDYCVPDIAEGITGINGLEVIAAGYSADKGEIVFRSGEVKQFPGRAFKKGYQIGYSSKIDQGMSGGAIITSDGTLIGINGLGAFNTNYVYQNGETPSKEEIQEMRELSWGIPVRTVLVKVKLDTLKAYSLPLPENLIDIPVGELTGWLRDLEQKAKHFTVRIDSTSGTNGSGVIIAREGNTYTVLTAAHVICEIENGIPPCLKNSYEVMTHDGKKYRVEESTIQTREGVDLGILKFTVTNRNYKVATLAKYDSDADQYVFVAGYPKLGSEAHWRFSPGSIFSKPEGLLQVTDSDFQSNSDGKLQTASSLTGGYELVYTSITYGGMSGGAVLDSQGRVIGIHGRAEGEEANDATTKDCGVNPGCKVQIGYSLGIPIRTFLGQEFKNVKVQKVEKTPAQKLNKQQEESIEEAVLSTDFPQGNAKASQWLERGNQLWRLRRYKEAVQAFDTAINQQPKSTFTYLSYYGKGLALATQRKGQEAITALEQAVKLKPDFVAAWSYLSLVYRGFKQPNKALIAIDRAIQLQPKNPMLYHSKSKLLYELQDYSEAEIAIRQAIDFANITAFHNDLGVFYIKQNKLELALKQFQLAINMNPNTTKAYYNRGVIFTALGRWESALNDFKKVIQSQPKFSLVYHNRGFVYRRSGQLDLAIADYTKAIQINPKFGQAYNNRGFIYGEQQKWDLAIADYSKAIQIYPDWAGVYYNRGFIYSRQKKWNLAIHDYNKAIQINPDFARAYTGRGIVYSQKNDKRKAVEDFQQAANLFQAQGNAVDYKLVMDLLKRL